MSRWVRKMGHFLNDVAYYLLLLSMAAYVVLMILFCVGFDKMTKHGPIGTITIGAETQEDCAAQKVQK